VLHSPLHFKDISLVYGNWVINPAGLQHPRRKNPSPYEIQVEKSHNMHTADQDQHPSSFHQQLQRPTILNEEGAISVKKLVVFFVHTLCGMFLLNHAAWAQTVQTHPQVIPTLQFDVSPPLRDIKPVIVPRTEAEAEPVRRIPRPAPVAGVTDGALQRSYAPQRLMPTTIASFIGIGQGFSGPAGAFTVSGAPPDTNMAVGPTRIVQIVNTDFAVFNKTGTVLFGPVAINTLWSGFGGGCQTNNDGDPVVQYDSIADRWVITQFSVSGSPDSECIAVSTSPDPTGSYNRYSFNYGTDFNDYPKLGVWPDAYYITYNIFANGSTFAGTKICALDRAKMLAGLAATQQCFNTSSSYGGVLPADLDGSRLPPAGSPNYLLGLGVSNNDLAFWKFHVDWTTPGNSTLTGPTTLTVATYTAACSGGTCIPQSGTSQQLDSLADRMMYRLAYRNFGDHEALVVNHSVTAGSSTGARWYELRVASGNLSLFQQGTYAPNTSFRWMGSIAMDQKGNMGLGFSVSSGTLHPGIAWTGRLAGDAAGQMTQGESTIFSGNGSQSGPRGLTRWGDYSAMRIDPNDDCTFWYTTEYIPSTGEFNWATGIASFKFPSCGAISQPPTISKTFGAASIARNGSTSLSFTIHNPNASSSLSGIGFSDTLPAGLVISTPNGLAGSCGGGTITAAQGTNVVSLSGATLAASASCTFSVNVIGTAAGDQNNTTGNITSTEGGAGGTASATLKVVAPPSINKTFIAGAIAPGGTTQLTFTITNPAANTAALTGVAFTDSLPVGILVATPNGLIGSCGGGTITATQGSGSVSLSGATLAINSSCTFAVNVTSNTPGNYTNTTGAVTSTNGGTGNTASANINVGVADISVTLAHHPDPATFGGKLVFVATVTNHGPQTANVSFAENFIGAHYVNSAAVTTGTGTCGITEPVSCTLSAMGNGESRQVTIVVTPQLGRNVVGTASVAPDVTDSNPNNNTASSTARVRFRPQRF